ncbi:unnamed protein product [Ambrosiozyma monospora]|uniref:Unnamed protein product n=1 Tax=Ambrosiozyma monospora TaxID=43982 RepID=A0A9W6YVG7_AMBMO|nr:unnamed protein product [Ambrosiozyma monospora]
MIFNIQALITIVAAVSALPAIPKHKHFKHVARDDEHDDGVEHTGNSTGSSCSFPSNYKSMGIVKLPDNPTQTEGWAKDWTCKDGEYCPYACPPGQLMGQWNPDVKTYSYPGSQDGGLYCNNGELEKHVKGNDYCYEGKGTASVQNNASKDVAFCQTVLPGNEAMLIPTEVEQGGSQKLAVPGTEYWAGTASHFYINPPGVSAEEGCQWGSTSNPYGNWSPYVAGFNMDDSGNTYAKVGWNPIWFESSSPFKDTKPDFGIKLSCNDESKCNGQTCTINPKKFGLNKVDDGGKNLKSDDAAWCIITAEDSSAVTIEVFDI